LSPSRFCKSVPIFAPFYLTCQLVPKCFPTRESSQQCDFHCSWTWGAQLAISLNPQGFRLLFLPALPSPFAPRVPSPSLFPFLSLPFSLPPSFPTHLTECLTPILRSTSPSLMWEPTANFSSLDAPQSPPHPRFRLTFPPLCQITARNVSPLHLHSRPSPSAILAHLPPGMSDHRQKCLPPPPPLPTLCSFLLLNSKDLIFLHLPLDHLSFV
jgi:hypothetical protein